MPRTKANTHTCLPACNTAGVNEAGTDEAGRGCLAGPVFAAAVILPDGYRLDGLNDSKQLTADRRRRLADIIRRDAVAWAVAALDAAEIDRLNILRASLTAMHRALDGLTVRPGAVIVDGNKFMPYGNVPFTTFVGGDGRFGNIAAASILAKTERDKFMERADKEYPGYGWAKNKGYPTADHRRAIAELGPSPLHRLSFRLLPLSSPSLFD